MSRTIKGVLGSKLGMTQIWDENNRVIPVTVVQVGPCVVTQVRGHAGAHARGRARIEQGRKDRF